MNNLQSTTPFFAWAGGKRWFTKRYKMLLPTRFRHYYEPSAGSAAVFFAIEPGFAVLSDVNSDLIGAYKVFKSKPAYLKRRLGAFHEQHSEEFFYRTRASEPEDEEDCAARFVYLNRTCWNGLYRVNKRGKFNVPKGTKIEVIRPYDDFEHVSLLLRNTRLQVDDFASTLSEAQSGDFACLDPPYTVRRNYNGFLKYNESIFSWNDQIRLRSIVDKLASRGVMILITNANHESIRELYNGVGTHVEVDRRSVLAANPIHRSSTSELAITINY